MQGTPATMQLDPRYDDVVMDVARFFSDRLIALTEFGVDAETLALDPGIGFGKTQVHNLQLLANLTSYQHVGRPIVLGVSRKGMIGQITGRPRSDRAAASMALACLAAANNPALVWRVHDVAVHRDAALLIAALDEHRNQIPF
jgi:dihydropteroate synthase